MVRRKTRRARPRKSMHRLSDGNRRHSQDEHDMADAVEEVGAVPEALAEDGEAVAEAAQRLDAVVESDYSVVARVGPDLALLLHVEPGGTDG